jgi:hypothetical protein
MEKYYKSYYLRDFNIVDINFVRQMQFGVKVLILEELGLIIAEVLGDKMDISFVVYYSDVNFEKIKNYHKDNYGQNTLMGVCDELFNGTKTCFYRDDKIIKYSINTYFEDGKPKLRQEFNTDFELTEYVQSIYDDFGNLIKEKIFYSDSWTIHTEKIIT